MTLLAPTYLAALVASMLPLPWPATAVAVLLSAALFALARRRRAVLLLLACGAGLLRGGVAVDQARADRLPPVLEGRAMALAGRVAEFPLARDGQQVLVLADVVGRGAARPPPRVRLGWAGVAPPPLGAWCELRVRLVAPRGLANPGGHDAEREAAARGLGARGRVIGHPGNLCEPAARAPALAALRQAVASAIAGASAPWLAADGAVVRAITVDDRSGLDRTQWQLMQDTGTGHLISISGLHVTLVALGAAALVRAVVSLAGWRRQRRSAVRAGAVAALLAATAYAALAGFGVPAQRALLMVAVAVVAVLGGRRVLGWDNWWLALVAVATLDPPGLLAGGTWLSFGAVAVLIAQAAAPPRRGLLGVLHGHAVLSLALAPLGLALFGSVAPAAVLANAVAIPWSSVLVVPMALLGVVLLPLADGVAALCFDVAARLWHLLWQFLVPLADILPAQLLPGLLDAPRLLFACAGLALLALPAALPGRGLAVLLMVAAWLPRQPALGHGEFRLHLFDVGQGLAALVETRSHRVLVDTGPRWWPGDGDAGASVVVPALAALGVSNLDVLLLSHADLDHAGGLASVLAVHRPGLLLGVADLDTPGAVPCRAPRQWRRDGVQFEILAPRAGDGGDRNDRSCVLAVRGAHGRLLLPGDIERGAEARLVARHGRDLAADVLVAPHHGSRTSSSAAFLAAVAPRVVLVPAGWGNRYGFPHGEVLGRYVARGSRVFESGRHGAITVLFRAAGPRVEIMRSGRLGFWRAEAAFPRGGPVW